MRIGGRGRIRIELRALELGLTLRVKVLLLPGFVEIDVEGDRTKSFVVRGSEFLQAAFVGITRDRLSFLETVLHQDRGAEHPQNRDGKLMVSTHRVLGTREN